MRRAEIGIIAGTGRLHFDMLEDAAEVAVETPYGEPSCKVTLGILHGKRIAFLRRHGVRHEIKPHMINYRANIWALKHLGVERMLATGAVGSLRKSIKPGDLVVIDQFIDFTKFRRGTFFDGTEGRHVSLVEPFCPEVRAALIGACKTLNLKCRNSGTYACIEGPRLSTAAESRMFARDADVIGMTLVPEAQLAREAELCYAAIVGVSDYDAGVGMPPSRQEASDIIKRNTADVEKIIIDAIEKTPAKRNCACKDALKDAFG
jgi:5'-methylthioadenosine phosphorylase